MQAACVPWMCLTINGVSAMIESIYQQIYEIYKKPLMNALCILSGSKIKKKGRNGVSKIVL